MAPLFRIPAVEDGVGTVYCPGPLTAEGKNPWYLFSRGWVGCQKQSGRSEEEKKSSLPLPGIEFRSDQSVYNTVYGHRGEEVRRGMQ
jgi:hypothetical protein